MRSTPAPVDLAAALGAANSNDAATARIRQRLNAGGKRTIDALDRVGELGTEPLAPHEGRDGFAYLFRRRPWHHASINPKGDARSLQPPGGTVSVKGQT